MLGWLAEITGFTALGVGGSAMVAFALFKKYCAGLSGSKVEASSGSEKIVVVQQPPPQYGSTASQPEPAKQPEPDQEKKSAEVSIHKGRN